MTYPPQQPHPYQQYPPQPLQPVVVPTSGWATASLVFGIISVLGGFCLFGVPCLLAVVAGHVGLTQTKDGRKGGRGLAVTGLILGYLFVIPAVIVLALGGIGAITGGATPTPTVTP